MSLSFFYLFNLSFFCFTNPCSLSSSKPIFSCPCPKSLAVCTYVEVRAGTFVPQAQANIYADIGMRECGVSLCMNLSKDNNNNGSRTRNHFQDKLVFRSCHLIDLTMMAFATIADLKSNRKSIISKDARIIEGRTSKWHLEP